MGFFDRFRRKQEKSIWEEIAEEMAKSPDPELPSYTPKAFVDIHDKASRDRYVFEKCETIIESSKEFENAKIEYNLVTSYLKDIQLIDEIPKAGRKVIDDIAKEIVDLQKQRKDYVDLSAKLSQAQFMSIRKYEDELPNAIKRLEDSEKYQATVKKDIQSLEGEKGYLVHTIDNCRTRQKNLKIAAIVIPILMILGLIALFIVNEYYRFNFKAFLALIIGVAAAASATVFFLMQKNTYRLAKSQANINYAITLLNRTKIKYVNETNAVEYAYAKYGVNSAYELRFMWDEYSNAKKEREELHRATDELNFFGNRLVNELAKYNVMDVNVWINQANALLDEKEMVEVRHSLNTRRQKIRSRMDYNMQQMNASRDEVLDLVKKYPQYSAEINELVNSISF